MLMRPYLFVIFVGRHFNGVVVLEKEVIRRPIQYVSLVAHSLLTSYFLSSLMS